MRFEFKTYNENEVIVSVKALSDLEKESQSLKKENARLREALGFYADNKNCANPDSCFIYEIDKDGKEIADGGYTARQALSEADKIKGELG